MEYLKIKSQATYPIGMVARMFDISVPTLRLYEQEGLVLPKKSKGGHRQYTESDVKRIHCIRNLIANQGLNLAGIRMMLSTIPCWELKPCSETDRQNCDAYHESTLPCWMVENKGDICKNEDCTECAVYKNAAECKNIKDILNKYWRK